jgi:alpha-tubulin suppressor-like RCC1 family protein
VRCWGANDAGQLGTGTVSDREFVHDVLGLRRVARLAAGRAHTCAQVDSGKLTCWGDNGFGQLGIPRRTTRTWPAPVAR